MFIKQCRYCPAAPCVPLDLAPRCNIRPLYPASINKAVISVPCCCVLPEDSISRLAMQGKPVALSRGATTIHSGAEIMQP